MKTLPESKEVILSVLKKNQESIRSYGVKKLGLFGSFVRHEQSRNSDIDLLVEFEPGKKNFDNFIQLSFDLEELFDRRVELVTIESLSPYIGPQIMAEAEYVEFKS